MENVFASDWEFEVTAGAQVARVTRVGMLSGARRLGASLYELEPGAAVSPLHVHHANEEMLLVVAGHPTVRRAAGAEEVGPGDVVAFPAGPQGAHRIENRGAEAARVLLVSTMVFPDVVEHLDSEKVLVVNAPPGEGAPGDLLAFRRSDDVVPYEGELPEAPSVRPLRDAG